MTTFITVGSICADVVSQATSRLAALLDRNRCGSGAQHLAFCPVPLGARARGGPSDTSLLAFTGMLESAAQATGMDHLGLMMAQVPQARDTGLLSNLLLHAPTVGQALEDMVRLFASVQTGTALALTTAGDSAELSYRILDPSVGRSLQDSAFTLGRIYRHLAGIAGPQLRLEHVAMAGAAPRNAHLYREFFQRPVCFDARVTTLRFSAAVLSRPIPTADPGRYAALCDRVGRRVQSRDEAALLEDALGAWILHAPRRSRAVTLEDAAGDFGVSVRTLQRRLDRIGLSFSDLRSRVRMETASRWLADSGLSVSHIGAELGFSETSAFTRAFRSYARQSPRAFRRAVAAPA